jgi:NADPH-dependent glutamate synthase beta subunit-like oxidoreductase
VLLIRILKRESLAQSSDFRFRNTVQTGIELKVLFYGQLIVERKQLGHIAEFFANFHIVAGNFLPEKFSSSLSSRKQTGQHPHRGGFAAAVGAEETENLSPPDTETDVIDGSEFLLDVDTVVMSIGTSPNPLIKSTTEGLEVNSRGGIVINEDGLTSRPAVYAGGDAVTGAATVISAMGAGKIAAKAIAEALSTIK